MMIHNDIVDITIQPVDYFYIIYFRVPVSCIFRVVFLFSFTDCAIYCCILFGYGP